MAELGHPGDLSHSTIEASDPEVEGMTLLRAHPRLVAISGQEVRGVSFWGSRYLREGGRGLPDATITPSSLPDGSASPSTLSSIPKPGKAYS